MLYGGRAPAQFRRQGRGRRPRRRRPRGARAYPCPVSVAPSVRQPSLCRRPLRWRGWMLDRRARVRIYVRCRCSACLACGDVRCRRSACLACGLAGKEADELHQPRSATMIAKRGAPARRVSVSGLVLRHGCRPGSGRKLAPFADLVARQERGCSCGDRRDGPISRAGFSLETLFQRQSEPHRRTLFRGISRNTRHAH